MAILDNSSGVVITTLKLKYGCPADVSGPLTTNKGENIRRFHRFLIIPECLLKRLFLGISLLNVSIVYDMV